MVRMPHWPKHFWFSHIEFGFQRIEPLLNKLGNPHLKLPKVIHVAGTNGKGSTVSFIGTILENAGYKVHKYTSPHLLKFNERIVLNGHEITDQYLYEICERCRIAEEELGIKTTFFEGTTVAAFLAFSENPADYLILETGMGGRLDATNIIESKEISVITPISYDHTEFLGDSLHKIAVEKAGIIKSNTSLIISLQVPEVIETLEKEARNKNSETIIYGYDYGVIVNENNQNIYKSDKRELVLENLSLIGDHQYINASTSIATIDALNLDISNEIILKAIQNTKWMARLQKISSGYLHSYLPKGWKIYVDGAHNVSGGQALSLWTEKHVEGPMYVLCGMTKNRDVAAFLTPLKPYIKHLIGLYVEDEPSSYYPNKICEFAKSINLDCSEGSSFEDAFEKIVELNDSPKGTILICGSLYLAAMFLRINSSK